MHLFSKRFLRITRDVALGLLLILRAYAFQKSDDTRKLKNVVFFTTFLQLGPLDPERLV